jgi:enoyl-CoA hydratase/carnithine racemase
MGLPSIRAHTRVRPYPEHTAHRHDETVMTEHEDEILYSKQPDGIALATFNRPAVLNAFRGTMFTRLVEILADVRDDPAVRVLVITGNGRAFSSGIDLEEQAQLFSTSIDYTAARVALDDLQAITHQLRDLSKPVIAAINGLAVGVGAELAIASDIRLASQDAYIMFAEVKRGLFETNGVMYFLPRLVGMGRAVEMLMTGDKIPAAEALAAGLVTRVYSPDDLLPQALALAGRIAANAPISLRLLKQVMARSYDLSLDDVMRLESDGMIECLYSDDFQEGVHSFLEKRAPNYRGK